MSWLSDLLNPGKGYQGAQDQLTNSYNQANSYMQPYSQFGVGAGNNLQSMLAKLMDPAALQAEWSKGYQESPEAQQAISESKTLGLDAASQMGLGGSSAAVSNIQKTGTNISNQYRQQYMNDLMNKYMQAIGIGQNMYGTGANAATNMASNTMNYGQNMAGLQYGKQNAGSDLLSKILGGATNIGMNYFTGGMGQGNYGRGAWAPEYAT